MGKPFEAYSDLDHDPTMPNTQYKSMFADRLILVAFYRAKHTDTHAHKHRHTDSNKNSKYVYLHINVK